jgi:putative hydrolase of the HAD superfamily
MSSSPVLVLDIDGVVSLAQPGSAQPWYATLKADWGFDHEEMARDFFRGEFMEVLRGRLDLYVALHAYLETKGLADRLEEFVAYWFARDAVIDRDVLAQADAWRQRTGGRCFAASNQEHHRVAYLREQAGLGAHFDEIVYSAALGVCKPERVSSPCPVRMGVTVAQSILLSTTPPPMSTQPAPVAGGDALSRPGKPAQAPELGLAARSPADADDRMQDHPAAPAPRERTPRAAYCFRAGAVMEDPGSSWSAS